MENMFLGSLSSEADTEERDSLASSRYLKKGRKAEGKGKKSDVRYDSKRKAGAFQANKRTSEP